MMSDVVRGNHTTYAGFFKNSAFYVIFGSMNGFNSIRQSASHQQVSDNSNQYGSK